MNTPTRKALKALPDLPESDADGAKTGAGTKDDRVLSCWLPADGRAAIHELGIPVVEYDWRWDADIAQKGCSRNGRTEVERDPNINGVVMGQIEKRCLPGARGGSWPKEEATSRVPGPVAEDDGRVIMETPRARRIKRKRVRRIVASVAVLGAIGLGIGFAAPAGASNGCPTGGPGGDAQCGEGGLGQFGLVAGGGDYNRSGINVGGLYEGVVFSVSYHENFVDGQTFVTYTRAGRVPRP